MVFMYAGSPNNFEIARWQCSTGFHANKPALLVVKPVETTALGTRDLSVFLGSCCSVSVLQLLKHTREVLPVFAITSSELWAGFDVGIKLLWDTSIPVPPRQREIESCLFTGDTGVILMACSPGAMPQLSPSEAGRMVFSWALICWAATVPAPALATENPSSQMSQCSSEPLTDLPAEVQPSFPLSMG